MISKRMADIYDVVALVLALAVCFPLGIRTTVRDYHEVKAYEANYKDKTAGSSYLVLKTDYGDYDGKLDRDTAILTSQIQEHNMMNQATLKYKDQSGNTVYTENITGTYKDNADDIANGINTALKDDPHTGGYRFKYDADENVFELTYETNKK